MPMIKELFSLLMIAAGGVTALALVSDLIGIGSPGFGSQQVSLTLIGSVILIAGIFLDLSIGQRFILNWYAKVIRDKRSLIRLLIITTQLGFLVLVIRQYHLENEAFSHNIMPLIFFGFLFHFFLLSRYRLPFFLVLCVASVLVVLGLRSGIWLMATGLILILVCHLPVYFLARVAILFIIAAFLALLRLEYIHIPWPSTIWPILGSMFMFRLIIYLHHLRHNAGPVRLSETLSYFFLLPNIVFPLFPVVDYKTFCRAHYDDDQFRIYQKGIMWIFRGVIHLLLYRCVNNYLLISPENVNSTGSLIQFFISNYLLYLRISGQFHLIVGILHLFGFNLPETNHLYYLASSFTDFWRRINIYWKDFMMKIFYYPAYFRLRKWGNTTALVFSTLFVFFATWLLHSYQWFWLRGTFPLLLKDILFWGILALLVVVNSLYEVAHGRERTLGKKQWTLRSLASLSFRVAGTFAVMCILWSLWTSASLTEWLSLWSGLRITRSDTFSLMPSFLLAVIALFAFAKMFGRIFRPKKLERTAPRKFRSQVFFSKPALVTGGLIVVLYVIGNPVVYSQLGLIPPASIVDLRVSRLGPRDAALLRGGYYEDLVGINRFNSELWEIYMNRPANWKFIAHTEAARLTGDFYWVELVPSSRILYYGQPYSINRWGMRDKDYELTPPSNIYRIALVGASHANGWGVSDNETFESLLEERLNHKNEKGGYIGYEILNFAVGGYTPLQHLKLLKEKVLPFKPDAVFCVAHPTDVEYSLLALINRCLEGIEIPFDYLREIIMQAGIDSGTSRSEALKRLTPHGDDIVSWAYRSIVDVCQLNGIIPVWILLPTSPDERSPLEKTANIIRIAEKAGFIVLKLSEVFEKQDTKSLMVASWDRHPNAKGHRLIAEQLYEALLKRKDEVSLGLSSQVGNQQNSLVPMQTAN